MDFLSRLVWGPGSNTESCTFQEGRIRLKINGSLVIVPNDLPPSTKLIDFIRNHLQNKGTKYMCREAGCGACIVAVKRFNSSTNKSELFAINSCIVPIFLCSDWNVITVEGIGSTKKGFHPIQSALAKFSGTQCGYCTPGMVMNMFGLVNGKEKTPTMEEIENSFGGNICRCTGYRSILDAFKSLASDASEDLKNACVDIEDIMKEMKICPKTNTTCVSKCNDMQSDELMPPDRSFSLTLQDNVKWIHVKKISEIYDIFDSMQNDMKYMLVAGHTSDGVYRVQQDVAMYIDVNGVDELHGYKLEDRVLTVGANTSLAALMDILKKVCTENPKDFSYLLHLVEHIDLVANVPVRNTGTIAGNLSIKHAHPEFPSDIFTLLEAARATLTIGYVSRMVDEYWLSAYLALDMKKRVIVNVRFPAYDSESYAFKSYKIMQRAQNTPAYVNAAFLFKLDRKKNYHVQERPSIVYGHISPKFIHAEKTETYLADKELLNKSTIQKACQILFDELQPNNDPLLASPEYRRSLGVNLLYKCILSILSPNVDAKYRSGGSLIKRPLSSGKQDYQLNKSLWPVGQPIPKVEAFIQCTGEAEYVNDLPTLPNELHVAVVLSKSGPAKLESIDTSAIKNETGFVAFISATDIPGRNTFVEGMRLEEEELFVSRDIQYAGQVVGAVIAVDQTIACRLADRVVVKVSGERKAVLDVKTIVESGKQTSRILQQAKKTAKSKKNDIKYKVEGSLLLGGQYHYTMETQTCYCIPTEDGIHVHAATQWPTIVQQNVCAILKLPMNSVCVNVRRCGGGYGAKLGRSTLAAGVCALAAYHQGKPVRLVMPLESNMRCIGKRFPLYAKYDITVNDMGEVQTWNLKTYHDSGAHTNDTASKEDFIYFASALYQTDTWDWTSYDVYTDICPNTYCRAPGSCEAVALIEYIMEHIAHVTKLDPITVRLNNLSTTDKPIISSMLDDLKTQSQMDARAKEIETYNADNRWKKRGLSVVFMNYPYTVGLKYHTVISIYAPDGTVAVTHGGVEIGQGINTKVAQVIAYKFGIDLELIKIKSTNTLTAPNDECTGGSNASDGVSKATIQCCDILLKRLEPVRKQNPKATWPELIAKANDSKVDLYAESQYTPAPTVISYNIYGLCIAEVEIDLLTGQQQIRRVDILEDVGDSMSPYVDIGQAEGAFVMGLGYWLYEKLVYDTNTGALLSDRTWTYTPPTAKDIPVDFRVYFRRNAPNAAGVLRSKEKNEDTLLVQKNLDGHLSLGYNSGLNFSISLLWVIAWKAIGEPPLCLSISAVFAIRNALSAARKYVPNSDQWFDMNLPYIPENILLSSLTNYQQFDI